MFYCEKNRLCNVTKQQIFTYYWRRLLMDDFEVYFSSNILPMLQNLIIALIVLLIGWIIEKMIASGVEKGIKKANLEKKVVSKFRETGKASGFKVITGDIS